MDWKKENWKEEDIILFRKELLTSSEEAFQAFQKKLIPGDEVILGIRTPIMKSIAKEIAKGNWREFLNLAEEDSYEEVMIQGFVIGFSKMDQHELLKQIKAFLPKIKNWAVCDCVCASLKAVKKNQEFFYPLIEELIDSNQEFFIRFGVVLSMDYYVDDAYVERIFGLYQKINCPDYYVKMAVAWAISVVFIKFKDKTYEFLNKGYLEPWTYQKALQKILESNRVSIEDKQRIRTMKTKVTS